MPIKLTLDELVHYRENERVQMLGFESEQDFIKLVGSMNKSTPKKNEAFKFWQDLDGTKYGLLKILSGDFSRITFRNNKKCKKL
jgi:hypothetical protein